MKEKKRYDFMNYYYDRKCPIPYTQAKSDIEELENYLGKILAFESLPSYQMPLLTRKMRIKRIVDILYLHYFRYACSFEVKSEVKEFLNQLVALSLEFSMIFGEETRLIESVQVIGEVGDYIRGKTRLGECINVMKNGQVSFGKNIFLLLGLRRAIGIYLINRHIWQTAQEHAINEALLAYKAVLSQPKEIFLEWTFLGNLVKDRKEGEFC